MQPAYLIRPIRSAGFVRPAGQTGEISPGSTAGALGGAVSTFNPVGGFLLGSIGSGVAGGISPGDTNPPVYDASGNLVTDTSGTADTSGKVPTVDESAAAAGMTPTDQTALFDAVASGLNTAGTTIAAIINSGDQLQIAQLQSQTQTQIAALNQQAQQAQAAGNMALAQQNAQRAAQMAQFQQAFLMRPSSNTGLYIVAGAVVLGIIGTFVYLGSSARKNPRILIRRVRTERRTRR